VPNLRRYTKLTLYFVRIIMSNVYWKLLILYLTTSTTHSATLPQIDVKLLTLSFSLLWVPIIYNDIS
jgi:hypothetical protein